MINDPVADTGAQEAQTPQPADEPTQPQQVEVVNQVETHWPPGIEGIDYETYTGNKIAMIVRHEITYGDILISTLLSFLIILYLIRFFHRLILGGKRE